MKKISTKNSQKKTTGAKAQPKKQVNSGPMRINRYLAEKGISTRRGADVMIAKGEITINGRVAQLGDKVLAKDKVEIAGMEAKKIYAYYAYYKPTGIVTVGAQGDEKEIRDVMKFPVKVFPIGRLDKDSEGLLIMTNDGRVTDRLLNPKSEHQKEYVVRTHETILNPLLQHLKAGVRLGDDKTKPALVRKTSSHTIEIVLTEGKNRQIRRMCASLGYNVTELKRLRIENIEIGSLKSGAYREIEGKELVKFLEILGLN